jgi:hypothetical protein
MMKKYLILFFGITFSILSNAQFDDEISKTQLYDKATDMEIYVQMLAKDKLYLINNLNKEQAGKELDYALAKMAENISDLDLNIDNPKIIEQLKNAKKIWNKFNLKITQNLSLKEFTNLYFEVNTFDRQLSDLVEKMKINYQLPEKSISKYDEIQKLRKLIQKISISYYADFLGLSKSFSHEYKKNIENVDKFIKQQSNLFLNDPVSGKLFSDVIIDWNFFRSNIFHQTIKNPKTIFSLSTAIDYKLKEIKNRYIQKLNQGF